MTNLDDSKHQWVQGKYRGGRASMTMAHLKAMADFLQRAKSWHARYVAVVGIAGNEAEIKETLTEVAQSALCVMMRYESGWVSAGMTAPDDVCVTFRADAHRTPVDVFSKYDIPAERFFIRARIGYNNVPYPIQLKHYKTDTSHVGVNPPYYNGPEMNLGSGEPEALHWLMCQFFWDGQWHSPYDLERRNA